MEPVGKDFLKNFSLFHLYHALTPVFIIKVCFPANTDYSGYGNDTITVLKKKLKEQSYFDFYTHGLYVAIAHWPHVA